MVDAREDTDPTKLGDPSGFDLWAKTEQGGAGWHALPYHLLDVGAAACALWSRLPGSVCQLVESFFADRDAAQRTVTFLAAAHDVGKANRYFQSKAHDQRARLDALGLDLPPESCEEPARHGQATGAYLRPWVIDRWSWDSFPATSVALAVGGHHGRFFQDCNCTTLHVDQTPWAGAGAGLLDNLADLFDAKSVPQPLPLNPFLGWIAGFVSVADWLGSHKSMTVWETRKRDLAGYLAEAQRRADELLESLNWATPHRTPPVFLCDIVPIGREPNGLQLAASEISRDFGLAIVEAPTGEGKTEAAFALTEPQRSRGDGIYFALPTMATANGLHARVQAFLQRGAGSEDVEARLLHSQAWLFREDVHTAPDQGEEGNEQEAQAQDWFAGSKRGLLTPYGVGTVDQVLIAALRAKHGFVRLFALAGKTVVIDEVHAYDVYMADLLDVFLGWLQALNCRVVLLSATLPKARREQLLRAWGFDGDLPQSAYPCITYVDISRRVQARSFEVQPRKPLTITLLPVHGTEPWRQGASRILERVQTGGGLGALVLNTVRDAQAAYQWLSQQELGDICLDLFHARFTAQDRDAIEKRVEANFGKNADHAVPRILVATQVIEQSLDLDFDHMVSALAPIDLLIQRAGRLHRHKRHADGTLRVDDGPDERAEAVLEVLPSPCKDEEVPELKEPIYAKDVLHQTHMLLSRPLRIAQPNDVARAVEAGYDPAAMASARAALREAFDEASRKENARRDNLHDRAAEACIPTAPGRAPLTFRPAYMEDDEQEQSDLAARTRIEDMPSVSLTLRFPHDSPTDGLLRKQDKIRLVKQTVRVPAIGKRLRELLDLDTPTAWGRVGSLRCSHEMPLDEQGSYATVSYLYTYTPALGLQWTKKDA